MPLRLRLLPSPAAPSGTGGGRGPTESRSIELPDDTAEIRIGRRPDLELPLPYPALSALHARLFRTDAGWHILPGLLPGGPRRRVRSLIRG